MSDEVIRSLPLEDVHITGDANGRTVEAYAAVFGIDSEIHDQHGHYIERNDPKAFNRTLSNNLGKVQVFYNHGMTIHGTPSELASMPIGTPVEIKPDRRGLKTVTRYNKTPLAEATLECIREGSLTSYSYTGRIVRSDPQRVPRVSRGQALPVVTRMEMGLKEYGPTPLPYFPEAAITAVRARSLTGIDLTDEEVEMLRATALFGSVVGGSATGIRPPGDLTSSQRMHLARNKRAIHQLIAERRIT